MAWTAADLTDLTGITAIVTGANNGIGFHTARELAAHGADVVLACRNVEAGVAAAAQMSGRTRVEKLDLASQASIADFAARWDGRLDLLINNAGVMQPPTYRTTEDGHELMFGTNHLGHYALTARLLPALKQSSTPRVVTVASIAHHGGDERVVEGNPEQYYKAGRDYAQSKLANVLFALELQRRAESAGSKLVSAASHPGVSATHLVASPEGMGANRFIRVFAAPLLPLVFQSAERGANPSLYAATLGEPGSYTGPQRLHESRGPIGPAKLSPYAQDADLAARLWERTEELTGLSLEP
ncbi:MAG TPA: SDR family NAD(P)-dependent oxidoreductase [Marmoricola sp.]|nr:SDR family NAD(P)-dependent oxidoreductase [Marmoricola sp.]